MSTNEEGWEMTAAQTSTPVDAPLDRLAEVYRRSAVDQAFRARLLADPREVLTAAGLEVPADVRIDVVESTPDTLVLPVGPLLDGDRLAELELAAANGGAIAPFVQGLIASAPFVAGLGYLAGR
jgi:hypothetical protein